MRQKVLLIQSLLHYSFYVFLTLSYHLGILAGLPGWFDLNIYFWWIWALGNHSFLSRNSCSCPFIIKGWGVWEGSQVPYVFLPIPLGKSSPTTFYQWESITPAWQQLFSLPKGGLNFLVAQKFHGKCIYSKAGFLSFSIIGIWDRIKLGNRLGLCLVEC